MVSYCFHTDRGVEKRLELPSLTRALYIAADHHERGYYIEFFREGNHKYSRDDVLLLCHKYNLL